MSADRYLTYDLAAYARRVAIAALKACRTLPDADLKHCVMTAREHGHLSIEEAEFYIGAWGLKEA